MPVEASLEQGSVRERELRRAFRIEMADSARATGRILGLIGVICFPLWGVFDYLVEPSNAAGFITLRLACDVPIAVLWGLLWTPFGRRHPEAITLAMLVIIEAAISAMVARLDGEHAAYALGLSLAIYASAFLLIWRWRYTAALIGATSLSLVVAIATAPTRSPRPISRRWPSTSGRPRCWRSSASSTGIRSPGASFGAAPISSAKRTARVRSCASSGRLSREDALTGLANRRSWDEALDEAFSNARAGGGELAVVLCDVDHFKRVNDRHGHAAGDRLLRTVADLLVDQARAGDLVARLGGDELAVL